MVVKVEVRVLDPHRVRQLEGDLDETAPERWSSIQAPAHHVPDLVEREASRRFRGVQHEHPGDVHVIGRRLHGQEHCVEPAQSLHRTSSSTAAVTEASSASFARLEAFHHQETGLLHPTYHQLGDPVSSVDLVGRRGIRVHQYDRNLAAITRVDQSRRVETTDAVAGGEPATGEDQARVALGDLESDPGCDRLAAAAGSEGRAGPRDQVAAGVSGPRVAGRGKVQVQADELESRARERTVAEVSWIRVRCGSVLVWMDLEMTGLDPLRNVIVEIATIVTDDELNIVAEGPDLVIGATPEQLADMDDVVLRMHTTSGLLDAIRESKVTVEEAAAATLEFVKSQVPLPGTVPLCGNSIAMDRSFLSQYMPALDEYFHYRSIDVSSVKELCKRWYRDALRRQTAEGDRPSGARRHPRERGRAELLPRAPVSDAGGGAGADAGAGADSRAVERRGCGVVRVGVRTEASSS